jgi:hypothetical protein
MKLLIAIALLALLGIADPASAALSSGAKAVTYVDELGERRIFAFATNDDGHLVSANFNGTSWSWMDHGLPAGATFVRQPQPLTYIDDAGHRRIYVFGRDSNSKLVLRYWNGTQWQWVNQGGPAIFGTDTSVLTYIDPEGNRRIYAFAVHATTYEVVVNYWNGFSWQWANNGAPLGHNTTVQAITYVQDGARRIDVFTRGRGPGSTTDFRLYSNNWNGGSWSWSNHGGTEIGANSPVTFVDELGNRRVFDFADRSNGMWLRSTDGSSWFWTNLGFPAGAPANGIIYGISAITYLDNTNTRHHRAFTRISGRLFSRHWNGSGWFWQNHGLPVGIGEVSNPEAISFIDGRGGTTHIYAFVRGDGENLFANHWNGSSWQWLNLGAP